MKPKQILTPDYLTGKWRVTAFYLYTNLGWKLTKQYGLNCFLWDISSDGKLLEKRKDTLDFITTYSQTGDELFIDRTNFDRGNILSLNSRYRIQPINETECFLYDLENITIGAKDSQYRLKLKRI